MELFQFVNQIKQTRPPLSIVHDGNIIDGVGVDNWTVEQITAEAFNLEILSVDLDTWETALEKVLGIMSVNG